VSVESFESFVVKNETPEKSKAAEESGRAFDGAISPNIPSNVSKAVNTV